MRYANATNLHSKSGVPDQSGRNEAITTKGPETNNWTKVSTILWYRPTKVMRWLSRYDVQCRFTAAVSVMPKDFNHSN